MKNLWVKRFQGDLRLLLGLEQNWDGEGALGISKKTCERVSRFVLIYAKEILKEKAILINCPVISPVADGSIDVLWENSGNQLVVNMPSNQNKLATFFFKNNDGEKHKGCFDPILLDDVVKGLITLVFFSPPTSSGG